MFKNKYSQIGITLGTIADYMRSKGGTPVEQDFHKVLTKMVGALEDQAQEIERLTLRVNELEDQHRRQR